MWVVADITDPEDMTHLVDETVSKYGRVDVFIHNAAGIYPPRRIDVMTEEQWHEVIKTNLDAVFYGSIHNRGRRADPS